MRLSWYQRNPEKARAKSKKWYEKNKEKIHLRHKAWRKANREKMNAYTTAWKKANRKKYNLARRARYRANPKRTLARNKMWRMKNAKGVRKYQLSFTRRLSQLISRGKKRGLPVTLTLDQYQQLLAGSNCIYCGNDLPQIGCALDRKDSDLGYTFENCVPCCRICNSIRGPDYISYSEMFEVVTLLKKLRGSR